MDKWLSYTTSGIGGPAGGDLDERRSTGLKRGSADIALLAKLEREAEVSGLNKTLIIFDQVKTSMMHFQRSVTIHR